MMTMLWEVYLVVFKGNVVRHREQAADNLQGE